VTREQFYFVSLWSSCPKACYW